MLPDVKPLVPGSLDLDTGVGWKAVGRVTVRVARCNRVAVMVSVALLRFQVT